MGFGERVKGCSLIVFQMQVDIVPSALGRRDFGNGAVYLPWADALGRHADDAAFGRRLGCIARPMSI
jgi:hypothetical protein